MRVINFMLSLSLSLSMALCVMPARAEPAAACLAAFEQAVQEQELISGSLSGRRVVGAGRLYLHTAPDSRCRQKDVFVIVGDRLEAFSFFGEFTHVIYWDPVTGAGTAGWVPNARVAATGTDIASGAGSR